MVKCQRLIDSLMKNHWGMLTLYEAMIVAPPNPSWPSPLSADCFTRITYDLWVAVGPCSRLCWLEAVRTFGRCLINGLNGEVHNIKVLRGRIQHSRRASFFQFWIGVVKEWDSTRRREWSEMSHSELPRRFFVCKLTWRVTDECCPQRDQKIGQKSRIFFFKMPVSWYVKAEARSHRALIVSPPSPFLLSESSLSLGRILLH